MATKKKTTAKKTAVTNDKAVVIEQPKIEVIRIESVELDGVTLTSGDKVVIEDEPGNFTFRYADKNGDIACWGGLSGHEMWRSFKASRCHPTTWSPKSANEQMSSRAGKYVAFETWAKSHDGEQFTTEQLVEVSGFSHQTTLKYLADSLIFTKVKKGLWEVRNIAERE
jgi:hypothetical protein